MCVDLKCSFSHELLHGKEWGGALRVKFAEKTVVDRIIEYEVLIRADVFSTFFYPFSVREC